MKSCKKNVQLVKVIVDAVQSEMCSLMHMQILFLLYQKNSHMMLWSTFAKGMSQRHRP